MTSNTLLRAGVVGVDDRTFVNLQVGRKMNDDLWLRFGMVQSHLGAGADYQLNHDLVLSGDLFNPPHPRVNALLDFRLKSFNDAFWLNAGVYNLFQPDTRLGIGLTYRP